MRLGGNGKVAYFFHVYSNGYWLTFFIDLHIPKL